MEFIGDRQVVIVVVVTTFLGWNLNVCKGLICICASVHNFFFSE